jgi:hypothetical protein
MNRRRQVKLLSVATGRNGQKRYNIQHTKPIRIIVSQTLIVLAHKKHQLRPAGGQIPGGPYAGRGLSARRAYRYDPMTTS